MKKGLLTLIVVGLTSSWAFSQQNAAEWQYVSYPDLPFVLDHLQVDLTVSKNNSLIDGIGVYSITSRRPDLTQVVFNSADMEIQDITFGEVESDYQISSDSLIIQLPDTLQAGTSMEMVITWKSSSPYGIIKDVYGNMWTSLNPKARHHWLPVPDHPEVATTIDASITIPADEEVVFNGTSVQDKLISADQKVVEWSSEKPISVTGLSFALGDFVRVHARSGVKEVSLYASESTLLPEIRDGLLSIAVSSMKEYERKLSFEFPYESLNIIVLPDNYWEEIQTGAGIIYLYQNLGSLATQLRRGIAEQWFGNYHRYLKTSDNKYEFLKVMTTGTSDTEQLKNPDELQSIHRWNLWEKGFDLLQEDHLKNVIEQSLPELMQQYKGVTKWNTYADFWYDKSGIYWEVLPEFELPETTPKQQYNYEVEYLFDEMTSSLTLVFEAKGEPIESLVNMDVTEFGFSDTSRSQITFTGAVDSVEVGVSSGIDYLTIKPSYETDLDIHFEEIKPFIFWIRQLQDPLTKNRIQAAKALQNFTENPDLQLAIRDALQDEEDAKVRAAMLETLSALTKDAFGTEETFLANLNSEDLAIKLSGLRALANYPENENVAYQVRNALLRADRDTVFNIALQTYQKLASSGDLLSAAERLGKDGQGDKKALKILTAAAPIDTTNKAMTMADRYALGEYPYSLRKQALKLLIEHEENEDYWQQTLEMLQEDRDPRIRNISLDAVKYLSVQGRTELLENRVKEELDPRVLGKIRSLMQ